MRGSRIRALLLTAAVLSAAGCDNTADDTGATTPTAPAPTVTETFSGTLTKNGAAVHTFVVSASGTVTATLSTVAPDSTVPVELGLGTWNGVICQIVLPNNAAVQGNVVTGIVSGIGTLCVRIADPNGTFAAAVDNSVQVAHP